VFLNIFVSFAYCVKVECGRIGMDGRGVHFSPQNTSGGTIVTSEQVRKMLAFLCLSPVNRSMIFKQ